MKIVYENKSDLIKGVQLVQNIIGDKTILPILANILINTEEKGISISATDLKISIETFIPLKVEEKGSITIPAKKFYDIIKELPDTKTEIKTMENNRIKINCGEIFYNIMGLPKQEFPKFPEIKKGGVSFIIDSIVLKEFVRKTLFAVAEEQTRLTLNGGCLAFLKDTIKFTTTDGRKLALINAKVKGSSDSEVSVIVPTKCMVELQRILPDDKPIEVTLFENKVSFESEGLTMVSSLIEGQYPKFDEIINRKEGMKIVVNSDNLLAAVKRMSIVAIDKSGSIKLNISKNKIVLTASTSELGDAEEKVEVKYDDKDEVLIFNSKYLIDLLRNMGSTDIDINFVDSYNAVIFKPLDNKDYTCILMPIRPA